ncbi:nucleoside phosphorylase [Rhodopila sp.]|uniref:nucleoside phosphorylase n=1 Tax=Rhodopila sp. TaxID=2480087 RepID=UPI003D11DA11
MNDNAPAAGLPPILGNKHHAAPAVFRPENLMREVRRQRRLPDQPVPEVCILDPDGDIVRALRADGRGQAFPGWACYHTDMLTFDLAGERVGIVGCAVGGAFAVLAAEQMFASGCRLLLSVTSAGRIGADLPEAAFFVLIDRALRDEGTSYHYLPAADPFAHVRPELAEQAARSLVAAGVPILRGAVWTTDAPYRETAEAIASAARQGVLAVEMEAAALYAFAQARDVAVLCLAHVTNRMAQFEGDFEKGEADGSTAALDALAIVLRSWRDRPAVAGS